jgi:hypothetical protein
MRKFYLLTLLFSILALGVSLASAHNTLCHDFGSI